MINMDALNRFFNDDLIREVLLESLGWLFILGAVVSFTIGVTLFLKPETIGRLNVALSSWVSGRRTMKPLEIMRDTDTYVYQHNKVFGTLMLSVSIVCLYLLSVGAPFEKLLDPVHPTSLEHLLLDIALWSTILFFLFFVTAGLPVWIMLIFSPDRLEKFSLIMNRWVSTRLIILPLEKMHSGFDVYVLKHNRVFGTGFILGSVYLLFLLLVQ